MASFKDTYNRAYFAIIKLLEIEPTQAQRLSEVQMRGWAKKGCQKDVAWKYGRKEESRKTMKVMNTGLGKGLKDYAGWKMVREGAEQGKNRMASWERPKPLLKIKACI